MPKAYEAMRDKFVDEGMPLKEAKAKASRIYNASRGKKKPVTGSEEKRGKARKGD